MAEENKPSLQTMVEQTTIADVYQAAKHLNGVAKKTRLIESPFFSEISGNTVYLKPENLIENMNRVVKKSEADEEILKLLFSKGAGMTDRRKEWLDIEEQV